MSQSNRTYILTALFSALVLTASVGLVDHEGAVGLKRETVRTVLDAHPVSLDAAVLEDAIARAETLYGIDVDSSVPSPVLRLHVTGFPLVEVAASPGGGLLVARLYDTIVVPEPRRMVIDGNNLFAGVRVYLSDVEPQFVTVVEIALSGPVGYALERRAGEITLTLNAGSPGRLDGALALLERSETAADAALSTAREMRRRADGPLRAARERFGAVLREAVQTLDATKVAWIESQLVSAGAVQGDLRHQEDRIQQAVSDFRSAVTHHESERLGAHEALYASVAAVKNRVRSVRQALEAAPAHLDALEASHAQLAEARAADATLFSALLERIRENDGTALERLEALGHTVGGKGAQTLDALRARLGRRTARLLAGTSAATVEDGLARLDTELVELRSSGVEDRLLAFSDALESVKADAPYLPLDVATTFAALSESELDAEFVSAPPARRSRPSRNSRTALARPRSTKLRMLRSSDEELVKARSDGIIVVAQETRPGIAEAEDVDEPAPEDSSSEFKAPTARVSRPRFNLYNPDLPPEEDPLRELVNIDFREMDLTHVVSLLAKKAQINVIAGTEVSGTVTANLQNIPLGRAIEIILRMNGLGIIEEDGVYRITTYEEAVASRRDTRMIYLKNAQALEVKETLTQVIGSGQAGFITVSANETANVLIVAGPSELVQEFETLVANLDIAEPVIPTITVPIKLNYSEPAEIIQIVRPLLSSAGVVTGDARGRHVIITDIPIKVEDIRELVESIDLPVKQVSIEAMIVDAILADDAQTGIDWIANAIRNFDRRGDLEGSLAALSGESDFTTGSVSRGVVPGINLGGQIAFGILTGNVDIRAAIAGEVRSENATLLANPVIVTIENQEARISIAEEIPYQELTQTTTGPPIATTEFKEVGTVLSVTPRVTHDNHIIVKISAKQSDTKGESVTGVPPEDKREAQTTLRMRSGQTIFIGGLRRFDDEITVRKVPILGDIPILGLLFRSHSIVKENLELLIFLTCHVLPDDVPNLSPSHKLRFDALGGKDQHVDGTRQLMRSYLRPGEMRDPFYKWRRKK